MPDTLAAAVGRGQRILSDMDLSGAGSSKYAGAWQTLTAGVRQTLTVGVRKTLTAGVWQTLSAGSGVGKENLPEKAT